MSYVVPNLLFFVDNNSALFYISEINICNSILCPPEDVNTIYKHEFPSF
ncbi:hypothetical protein DI53_2272 [Sphingobacterium deserti]|uniref:Uncharacterized protein n=1 Tax=Sphingobacterium deserti TaxID=1229276 RepID=A0A0B8T431_9SPHI|nr:hypothetical protein DI53_2272 [Sphingobacterium deserti]